MNGADGIELKNRIFRRHNALKSERATWDSHWKELASHMLPRRGRFDTVINDGRKRHSAIVNNTPLIAARNLAAGMTSGLTSPARPWFSLAVPNPELNDRAPVKIWLETVGAVMRDVMGRSNLYNCLATSYSELGVFGTAALGIVEDHEDGIRATAFTAGEYVFTLGERGTAQTVMRELTMTVETLVNRFGLDKVSTAARNRYDQGDYDTQVALLHVVEKNPHPDPVRKDSTGKKYRSYYMEVSSEAGEFLSVGGFDEMPILCPRWNVSSTDVYGTSPGMDALGDAMALQTLEKKRAQALEKLLNPPMVADPSLKNQPATVLPGGVTFAPGGGPRPGFAPAYQINPPLAEMRAEIMAHEGRIRRAFYEDLFLMLASGQVGTMTAREVEERHEEKLLMLGPVLERLHDELLDPLIDRVFAIMLRNRWIPDPPDELKGTELKVEYTSVLAQAQKAHALGAMEAFTGFVSRLSTLNPEVLDCVDFDRMVGKNAEAVGLSPSILKDSSEVEDTRKKRAARVREMAAAAAASQQEKEKEKK